MLVEPLPRAVAILRSAAALLRYSVKRDLMYCQKRPNIGVKRDLISCVASLRSAAALLRYASVSRSHHLYIRSLLGLF